METKYKFHTSVELFTAQIFFLNTQEWKANHQETFSEIPQVMKRPNSFCTPKCPRSQPLSSLFQKESNIIIFHL